MRRLVLLLTTLAFLAVPVALAKSSYPETIQLPNGFQPEGIAVGKGNTFYVGSIPTGAVYAGSLRTGTGDILVPGATGHAATGLEYDRRTRDAAVNRALHDDPLCHHVMTPRAYRARFAPR